MTDPTALRPGDVARRTRTVRARDIELFTELTGDRNPVHYDADLAARSRFGGIVVQGGVTTGLLNALVAEDLPGPGSVFLHVDWSFRAPVRPGDVLTAEARVLDVRGDKPICTLATTVRTAEGVVVVDGTAVVWRDPVVRREVGQRGTQQREPEQPAPTMEERNRMTMTHTAADRTSTPTLGAITHVALTVRDLGVSVPFYQQLIGAEPVLDEDTGPFRHVVFALGDTLLGLHLFPEGIEDVAHTPRRPGLDHVSFGCADRSELVAWERRLDELGVAHGGIVGAHYGSGLSFEDPDGLPLELFCPPSA